MRVRWCPCCFLHRPTVLLSDPQHFRSPLSRMAQVWSFQQTPQRPFGPCRGRSLWMKVRWCSCCFLHRPTVHGRLSPNTSGRRCQGWHRCVISSTQQLAVRPLPRSIGVDEGALVFRVASSIAQLSVVVPPPTLQVAVVEGWRRCGNTSTRR